MKLVNLFADFLKDTVNLNQTRIDLLDDSVSAIKQFIRDSDWRPHIRGFEEQGSWAHQTIIKPVEGAEFDADLLVMIDHEDGWSAADYVNSLGTVFKGDGTYKDKTKVWDYCVTITYAGDRKIDIAPCVVGRQQQGQYEVCNRTANNFRRSEPTDYTAWLKEKNTYSGSNSFRKVTRLVKYLRDIKGTFTCRSVLLTTLLGNEVQWFDKDTDDFSDVPTTLRTLIGRLDDRLQANEKKFSVLNPKLTTEDFTESWTEEQYSNFRAFIHKYRGWVDEAYDKEGRTDSIKAWRKIFGDEFAKGEAVDLAKSLAEGVIAVRSALKAGAAHLDNLVDLVKGYGTGILPPDFYNPPHMQRPPWRALPVVPSSLVVTATWHAFKTSPTGRPIRSGDSVPRSGGIWFTVNQVGGVPIPSSCEVSWRITNTGVVALASGLGRGGFYTPQNGIRRWEELSYRGVHLTEAFLIRRQDMYLIAKSNPFEVVID